VSHPKHAAFHAPRRPSSVATQMRSRVLLAASLALVGCALMTGPTMASAPAAWEVKWIVHDCTRDGDLDRRYSLTALRAALASLSAEVRDYTDCAHAIDEAIRKAERKLRREVKRLLRDCSRDGDLDRRYSLTALKAARASLSEELRDYTDCARAIRKVIKKVKRKLRREVKKLIRDCSRDGGLDRRYSLAALRLALNRLPDDVRDYTDCEQAIRKTIRRRLRSAYHHGERPGRLSSAGDAVPSTAARLRSAALDDMTEASVVRASALGGPTRITSPRRSTA
jgi:hypothetical protein